MSLFHEINLKLSSLNSSKIFNLKRISRYKEDSSPDSDSIFILATVYPMLSLSRTTNHSIYPLLGISQSPTRYLCRETRPILLTPPNACMLMTKEIPFPPFVSHPTQSHAHSQSQCSCQFSVLMLMSLIPNTRFPHMLVALA